MIFPFKQIVPQSFKNVYHLLHATLAIIRFGYPARKLIVIGVTGTDGKTTTSTIIYHLLKTAGKRVALVSTVAAYIGHDSLDTGFHVTSPNPWQLQQLLSRLVKEEYQYLVLEATSHGLDQHRLLGTNISIGVVTNVTHEHLDYHRTYDRYLHAKAKLFHRARYAILNQDDQSFEPLKKHITRTSKAKIIPYRHHKIPAYIVNRFPEPYNQLNAIAAKTVARLLSIPNSTIETAIASFPGIPGRMEMIPNHLGLNIIVDFAHTPNSLRRVLTALKTTTTGKLIAVYGAAGHRDHTKRPMMGEIGARLADEVVLTAEDPRTEDVHTIINQMKSGITQNYGHVHAIIDRQRAINFAITTLAAKGDTIAILGKGHEKSLNLDGTIETPWSDQQAARTAIKLRKKSL